MAQAANKNIDNASGQVVRLDIQNTLQTVATNNFGPRNSAGTILPCEFLADDTTNKLLIRKSSGGDQANPSPSSGTAATFFEVGDLDTVNLGLLSKSGGTMTGVLQLPNGSQSAPSLRFGDAGTGLFRGFSNTVSFTSDGSKIFHVDSNGININSSKELKWRDNDSSHFISFKAPSTILNNLALTLPTADGTSGQALITNGSGTLSFGTPTVGAANLSGNTLASGVTASSLTSVGTLSSLAVSGTCTATTFSGSGASLTNIPANQLSGTIPDNSFPSVLPAISGANLTNLPVSGTPVVEVVSLSSNQTITSTSYTTILTLNIDPSTSGTSLLITLGGTAVGVMDSDNDKMDCLVRVMKGSTQIGNELSTSVESSAQGTSFHPISLSLNHKDTSSHGGNTVQYTVQAKKNGDAFVSPKVLKGTNLVVREIL